MIRELDIDFYNYKSDTNTALPRSIILNINEMPTAIADYNARAQRDFLTERNTIRSNSLIE